MKPNSLSKQQLSVHTQLPLAFLDDNEHHYLLLDGVKIDPLSKWIYETFDNPEWYPLYKNTRYHDVLDISPCLVSVSTLDEVIDEFVNVVGPEGKAIWLSSPLPLESLGYLLSQWLWVTTADGGFMHYRFYDPLTLSRLVPRLQPNEISALYRGLRNIVWFDVPQNVWAVLPITPEGDDTNTPERLNLKREWIDAIITETGHEARMHNDNRV